MPLLHGVVSHVSISARSSFAKLESWADGNLACKDSVGSTFVPLSQQSSNSTRQLRRMRTCFGWLPPTRPICATPNGTVSASASRQSRLTVRSPDDYVSFEEAQEFARSIGAVCFETSAKTGQGTPGVRAANCTHTSLPVGIDNLFQHVAQGVLKVSSTFNARHMFFARA